MRRPVHVFETIAKYRKVVNKLTQDLGRKPLAEEIAAEMDLPVKKIYTIQQISNSATSLERAVSPDGDESGSSVMDFIPSDEVESPDTYIADKMLQEHLSELLDKALTPKEKQILMLRTGWGGQDPLTLEEIGKIMGVTRERVRQIQEKAINKLKMHPELKKLEDYCQN